MKLSDTRITEIVMLLTFAIVAIGSFLGGREYERGMMNPRVNQECRRLHLMDYITPEDLKAIPRSDLISQYALRTRDPDFTFYPQADGSVLALSVDLGDK